MDAAVYHLGALEQTSEQIYEYQCQETIYDMYHWLDGAREREKRGERSTRTRLMRWVGSKIGREAIGRGVRLQPDRETNRCESDWSWGFGSRAGRGGGAGVGASRVCLRFRRQEARQVHGHRHEDGIDQSPRLDARGGEKADGTVENWMIEAGSPNSLFRQGINKDTVRFGMQVVVDGYQARTVRGGRMDGMSPCPRGGSCSSARSRPPVRRRSEEIARPIQRSQEAHDAHAEVVIHRCSRRRRLGVGRRGRLQFAGDGPAGRPPRRRREPRRRSPADRRTSGPTRGGELATALPDGPDGVKHEGWTSGSVGAVFAETPDRILIAQRGELPLPGDREAVDAVRAA